MELVERILEISNFRNFGVRKDEYTYLCLNRGLEEKELGELVILLEINNSGESNMLSNWQI